MPLKRSNPNFKPFYTSVSILEVNRQKAFEWKSSVEVKEVEKTCTAYTGAYNIKKRTHLSITNELIKSHEAHLKRCSWPDFDTFKFHQSQIWRIRYNMDDWSQSSCSCPVFIREYCCKHVIGIGMKKKNTASRFNRDIGKTFTGSA